MKRYILNLLVFSSLISAQTVYWVDGTNGNDNDDGTAEARAFKTIAKGLAMAGSPNWVDTIKVKAGTYDEFSGNNGWTLNPSSSYDFVLIGVEGSSKTIFDAGYKRQHFSFDDGQSNKTIIQGITFQKGKTDSWPGAGSMYLTNSTNIQFIDCVWKDNSTTYYEGGGAINIRDGSAPSFTNCVFDSNYSVKADANDSNTRYGGAVRISYANSKTDLENEIVFKRTKFLNNYIESNKGGYGGAIYSEKALRIENSLFVKNYVKTHIDGTYNDGMGGAIYHNATRWNNSSYDGGNMYISNSTFHGNYIESASKNFGNLFGAAIVYGQWNSNTSSKSYIFNTVITGSRILVEGSTYITTESNQLRKWVIGSGNEDGYKMTADYSVIQAPKLGKGWGDYIYDITPAYKDTANGDYSLADNSPLIGAGVMAWTDEGLAAPPTDLLGNTRPSPSGSSPDIGAYENSLGASNAPMPVTGLVVDRASSGAKLSWTKIKEGLGSNTDASNIEYQIYQDGNNVAQTTANSYHVTGLTNGITYKFSVSAKNTQTNTESALSSQISVTPRYQGPRWHVASSGGKALSDTTTNYNYGSYDSPINHLSNALEITATGDTIIMIKGTHTGSNNRGTSIIGSKKLVISGDLLYTPSETIIDAGAKDRHFKFSDYNSTVDSTFVIQHITLTNGLTEDDYGGGSIMISEGSPKLHKVIFKANVDSSNSWRSGGAVSVHSSGSVIIDSCVFDGNRVSKYSTNSTDNENFSQTAYGGGVGFQNTYSRSIVRSSTFKNNKVYSRYNAYGSAIYASADAVDIINNVMYNNETSSSIGTTSWSQSFGTIYFNNGPYTYSGNNWKAANIVIANNTIVNNHAINNSTGGAMSGIHYSGHENSDAGDPITYAFNNIIYGNTKTEDGQKKTEEFQLQLHGGKPIFRNDYNLIYNANNLKNGSTNNATSYLNFDYTLDADPGFKDSTNGDYSLSNASLAIGAGIADWSDWGVKAPTTDILGGTRPNPAGSAPDIGAYENSLAKSPYPGQVKNVTAVGGSGSVTLSWDPVEPGNDDITYKVYMDTKPFEINIDLHVGSAGQGENPDITITGLDNSTRYYFRVTATNKDGYESTASASIDITPTYSGPIWWVSTTGNDETGEGSSGNPYKSLKHALEHVTSGDTIMIKPGTYTGSDNRGLEIEAQNATESAKYKNLVITSEKGPSVTIFDAGKQNRHFKIEAGNMGSIDSTLQIIGITFRGGRTSSEGGSFYLFASDGVYNNSLGYNVPPRVSPKFVNCVFVDNASAGQNQTNGGAVWLRNAAPIFESCVFDSNFATAGGAIFFGGNNSTRPPDTLRIRNSTIKNNYATDVGVTQETWGISGGGLYLQYGIDTYIYNTVFENNGAVAYSSQGGTYGGALNVENYWRHEYYPMIWIINSRFTKNHVNHFGGNTNTHGGAIHIGAPHVIANTVIDSNHAAFSGGNGRGMGGGLFISIQSQWDQSGNEILARSYLVNNTIVNNEASSAQYGDGENGGIYINYGPQTNGTWFNNIIWGNRATENLTSVSLDRHNIHRLGDNDFKLVVDYNNIEFLDVYDGSFKRENSYNINPGFVNPASNYRLSDASPLIGLGKATFDGINGPTTDILNTKRPNPDGSNPDLGAYENALAESPNPKGVRNLVAIPGGGSVTLNWTANDDADIEKYLIYTSTQMNFNPTKEDSTGETTDTTFTVTGLTNGENYYFKVAAQDKDGYKSVYSEVHAIPKYSGPTWWVDVNKGLGQGDCDGSQETPCGNLNDIFPIMANGDTIRMIAGDYGPGYNLDGQNNQWGNDLRELTIIGNTGNPEDVKIWGNNNNRHFELNKIKITFRDLSMLNGEAKENEGGGAIRSHASDIIIDNCIFQNNKARNGGAIRAFMSHLKITNSKFLDNVSREQGGAISVDTDDGTSDDLQDKLFIDIAHSEFKNNQVDGDESTGNAWGGAIFVWPGPRIDMLIRSSLFDNNYTYCRSEGSGAVAGAIIIQHHWNSDWGLSQSDIKPIEIRENIIKNNYSTVQNNSMWLNAAVYIGWNSKVINNLFLNNYIKVQENDTGGGTSALAFSFNDGLTPKTSVVNNTIVGNYGLHSSGDMDAQPLNFWNSNAVVFNNIIWGNNGDKGGVAMGEKKNVKVNDHNNIEFKWGNQDDFGPNTMSVQPKFKNPSNENYQLSNASQLIDMGTKGIDGYNSPQVDLRGYYRVGEPDIGAYEAGASKYLLKLADDVDTNFDTTFVKLGQNIKYTITTNDIDGNIVSSDESVSWNIFPNDKYVKFISGDINTQGGDASATFQVTQQTRGKGFRFRIDVGVGDAFLRSPMYVVEELVTGAPPPVLSLKITPDTWTNNPDFKLEWATPEWSEKRDLIGAVVEITDGYSDYNEYLGFPSGDTLTSFTFTVPEPNAFHTEVWLVDEYGNEDQDSARSATAYFDNVMPENFWIHNPDSHQGDIFYSSDKPRFEWDDMGDYPSGIKHWDIYINNGNNKYGTFTRGDISVDQNNPNLVYINGTKELSDGYYEWWVVAVDSASNATFSDTGYFGVDLSPPNIVHSNPLTVIDENTTSPAINATFTDGASGVKTGRLHYRRAGTGAGFVTVDLLSGSVNIPGSDVKSVGLEYYIDTEDNIGNYGKWPQNKAFQSVKVRTESSVSTSGKVSLVGGTDSTNYIFFSIPYDVGNGIGAFKSVMDPENKGPDEFKYRLYAYNNGWQENPSSLTMGNGYFFIFDPDKYDIPSIAFDFGQGVSTETDPPYQVNVAPGQWKFFGLPYDFNVSLSNIYTETGASLNDAGSIYTWNGSWAGVGSSLQPWKGYIFKSGGDSELNIDARGAMFGKMAESFDDDNVPMDANEWIIDIIAATGNTRDELNSVGVHHNAKDGYDRLDEFEPPTVPGNITLRIDNRDRELSPDIYAKDIRKPNENGHYWDLQVYTPTNGQRTYITFEGLGYVPQEYDIFIINKTNKQAKNLEWESTYRFANTGTESYLKQDLRLVIGTKQFVEDNNAGVELYPDAFTLSQNYPNPFNPQTSIRLSLEEDANVDLIIYNLLGEEITRLAANEYRPSGYYNFIWNGRNAMGNKVSTGVYLYHAMVRDTNGKIVLNKTKKMIFLK